MRGGGRANRGDPSLRSGCYVIPSELRNLVLGWKQWEDPRSTRIDKIVWLSQGGHKDHPYVQGAPRRAP